MIKSSEELLQAVKDLLGEAVTTDAAITLIEDLSDTLADTQDSRDWKAEAERIDREWRDKYTARFFSGADPEDPEDPETEADQETVLTFDELFEENEEDE